MDTHSRELYDIVSESLYEMTWHCNLPINPNVALWSFLEGFRLSGADVGFSNGVATITASRMVAGTLYSVEAVITADEIAKGWGWNPPSSPHALYDSICEVYDRMGAGFKITEESEAWFHIRSKESSEVKDKMEEQLKAFFPHYQEHMLMPRSGVVPVLGEPLLFDRVLKDFPLGVYEQSKQESWKDPDGPYLYGIGPCAETLLEIDWSEFRLSGYYPSEKGITS